MNVKGKHCRWSENPEIYQASIKWEREGEEAKPSFVIWSNLGKGNLVQLDVWRCCCSAFSPSLLGLVRLKHLLISDQWSINVAADFEIMIGSSYVGIMLGWGWMNLMGSKVDIKWTSVLADHLMKELTQIWGKIILAKRQTIVISMFGFGK